MEVYNEGVITFKKNKNKNETNVNNKHKKRDKQLLFIPLIFINDESFILLL